MKRAPRNLHQSIFTRKTVMINLLQGFGVLIATFLLFVFAVKSGRSENEARAFAFVSLVLGNLMLIAINLSWTKTLYEVFRSANKVFFIVMGGGLLCLFGVVYIPFFASLFHLSSLFVKDVAFVVIAIFVSLLWFEGLKVFNKYNHRTRDLLG